MTIEIKNVAKIVTAKVDISGITVLAGPNGSGKSTLSRSLMATSSLSLHMAKLMEISRLKSVLELVTRLFSEIQVTFDVFVNLHYEEEQIWKPLLTKDFWQDYEMFLKWCEENFGGSLDRQSLGYMSTLSSSKIRLIRDKWIAFSEEVCQRLAEKDIKHARSVADDVVLKTFAGQVKPLGRRSMIGRIVLSDDGGSVSISLKNGEVVSCSKEGVLPVSSLFYIEPLNQLDSFESSWFIPRRYRRNDPDRYTALEYCYYNVINLDKPAPMTMEEKRQWRLTCACVENILKKIGGRLDKQTHRLFFNEDKNGDNISISLLNVASGIKSIASVCRAIEMNVLKANGLLIIDEPESNLHPDWQVAVAEFLVSICAKRGIKVLINTHSPYMLRALRHFEKKSAKEGLCSFYQMIEGPNGYVADPVTNKVDVLFQDLFAPFEKIMRD